ncbi:MAG: hypothetical protein R3185_07770 [Candidatus Thermoplasmatota archaeon]|nr:hypothetical protein [Candidatus Thermoplasmatota archaeon]
MSKGDDETPDLKPFKGPVTVEQGFQVDGRKLTVKVQFPAQVAEEVGMENLVAAANRAIVTLESKNHDISKIRRV